MSFGEGEKDGIVRDQQVVGFIICMSGVYERLRWRKSLSCKTKILEFPWYVHNLSYQGKLKPQLFYQEKIIFGKSSSPTVV